MYARTPMKARGARKNSRIFSESVYSGDMTTVANAYVALGSLNVGISAEMPIAVQIDWEPEWKEAVDAIVREVNEAITRGDVFKDEQGKEHVIRKPVTKEMIGVVCYTFQTKVEKLTSVMAVPIRGGRLQDALIEAKLK